MAITEFLLFVLTAALGGMFLRGASSLIAFFRMFQFIFLSIIWIYQERCTLQFHEATMKYSLMGEASFPILVYGLFWLYGLFGGEI